MIVTYREFLKTAAASAPPAIGPARALAADVTA